MFKYASVFGVLVILGMVGGYSEAAECRKTPKVVSSAASINANTAAGGHVSIHVVGYPTAVNKSRFANEQAFTSAFTAWKNGANTPTPKVCGGGSSGQMDCVKANLVNINVGYVCKAVNADGTCTEQTQIVPVKVAFRYAKSNGVWILNTAYPSVNENCQ